jgi:hypothetical protein
LLREFKLQLGFPQQLVRIVFEKITIKKKWPSLNFVAQECAKLKLGLSPTTTMQKEKKERKKNLVVKSWVLRGTGCQLSALIIAIDGCEKPKFLTAKKAKSELSHARLCGQAHIQPFLLRKSELWLVFSQQRWKKN